VTGDVHGSPERHVGPCIDPKAGFDRGISGRYNHETHRPEDFMADARRHPYQGQITPEIFDHLVELAALELGPDEAEYLRRELNGQLNAIHELEDIDVDETLPITSHGVPYHGGLAPALRADRAVPGKLADDILAQAPEVEGRYVVVPDIPHRELE
jgi:aspartyl-tRNA(Asn)/glutamyl-tRNA(Gln) amidotransferase subunit C